MFKAILNKNLFAQNLEEQFKSNGSFNTFILMIVPFLIVGYFISMGVTSQLENTFAGLLIVFGIFFLIKNKPLFAKELKILLSIGLALFAMVFLQAWIGNDLNMLFKFQFANLRNMLILPFIVAVILSLNLTMQSVWRVIILSGLYTIVYSVLVVIEQPQRGEGLLSEAIVIGNMAMMIALLSLIAAFGVSGKIWKALAITVFFGGITLSMLSGTRTGLVAFVITGLLLLWSFYGSHKRNFYVTLGLFVLFGLITILFWEHIPVQKRVMVGIHQYQMYIDGNSNTSVGARLDMWKIGLLAFFENPLLGWGTTPFKETFIEYVNNGAVNFVLSEKYSGYAQPHNDYILLLYHFGAVGFLLAMSFILYPAIFFIKQIRKAKRKEDFEVLYFALTGLVATEVLLDFMMFNLAFMNKIFYVYVIVVLMVLAVLLRNHFDSLQNINNK